MTERGFALPRGILTTNGLSGRQERVLEMTLKGLSKKYIAAALGVAPRTVTNDRKAIRMALRRHIDIDSLEEVLLQVFHEFDLNWRKTNKIIYNSSNDYAKLRAINLQLKCIDKKFEMLRTLGFIATESEKPIFGKRNQ